MRTAPRTADLVQLRVWAEALCRLGATDPVQVLGSLGAGHAPAAHIGGLGRVEPPPLGTSRCELSVVQGVFRSLSLTFEHPTITWSMLDDAFGAGMVLRRVRAFGAHQVAYRVVLAQAPFTCDVIASFDRPPGPASAATGVMLRRRRAVHRVA